MVVVCQLLTHCALVCQDPPPPPFISHVSEPLGLTAFSVLLLNPGSWTVANASPGAQTELPSLTRSGSQLQSGQSEHDGVSFLDTLVAEVSRNRVQAALLTAERGEVTEVLPLNHPCPADMCMLV